jgi:ATP-binding cassette subfamily B protein
MTANTSSIAATTLPNTLGAFIWRYLRNQKIYLAGFALVAIMGAVEISLGPYLLKVMINTVIQYSADLPKLLAAITFPAALYILLPMIETCELSLRSYFNLKLFPAMKAAVGKDVFTYLLHHSYAFFQNTFTGSLTKKIGDLVERQSELVNLLVDLCDRVFVQLVAMITLASVVNPIFGVIIFSYAIVFVYISYIAAIGAEKYARHLAESGSQVSGTISDSITNVMSTKLFGNLINEVNNLNRDIDQLVIDDRAAQWYNLKVNVIQRIGVVLLMGTITITLIYGNIHGWVSAGDFAMVSALVITFIRSVRDIGLWIQKISNLTGVCNQALNFIRVPHEIINQPNAPAINISKGEIKFVNVDFKYADNNQLFSQLNVTIAPGERVGLVGYSGGGKSTFIKLILRLIDTQSGSVLLDGQDVKHVTLNSIRKQIDTIPQETDLFHRSIMENIRFARMEATDAEVIEAAKKARCHEFICEFPEQYQALVGEHGVKLSGGQRQRIAIARAFLKNAPILLLDEATSSLDSITEDYIKDSLHEVMMGKTTIVIAHRLSTLKDMHRILVFAQGKIVEDAPLQDLLGNKNSHFYKLWQMQAEGFIPPSIQM